MKCKKKGHLAFNYPPEYSHKMRRTGQNKTSSNKGKQSNRPKEESTALVKEFTGSLLLLQSIKNRIVL